MTMPTFKVDMLDCANGHHDFGDDADECRVCGHKETTKSIDDYSDAGFPEERHLYDGVRPFSFASFLASKRRTETICADLGFDDGEPERGGFTYDGGYIEDSLYERERGKYYLLIERFDWISDDLAEMEKILWACHIVYEIAPEGYTLAGDAYEDLDAFIQGHCAAHNIRVDGDVFAQIFSGPPVTPREAARLIDDAARIYGLYKA